MIYFAYILLFKKEDAPFEFRLKLNNIRDLLLRSFFIRFRQTRQLPHFIPQDFQHAAHV